MLTNKERIGEALNIFVGMEFKRNIISEITNVPPRQVTNIVYTYFNHRLGKLQDKDGNKKMIILPSDGLPDPVSNAKVKK